MTVKLKVSIEPVDETVHVNVTGQREGKEVFYQDFSSTTSLTSSDIAVEYGDKIQVVVTADKKIVLDNDQFVAKLENQDQGEIKAKREEEKKALKEAQEKHEEDAKKRAENAKKLETKFRKEADEEEHPSKPPPFPAPLELEEDRKDEHKAEAKQETERGSQVQAQRAGASPAHPVPPRGGAASSKEVK
jgi:hypothetical protein